MNRNADLSLEDFKRLPGLYRRWELTEVFEPNRNYQIEDAGAHADGTPLLAIYVSDPAAEVSAFDAELPVDLPAAVAIGLDGAPLVATRSLSRAEFTRVIEIRGQQSVNDSEALRELRQALRQADRFWADHPDWTLGQCLDAILAAAGKSSENGR